MLKPCISLARPVAPIEKARSVHPLWGETWIGIVRSEYPAGERIRRRDRRPPNPGPVRGSAGFALELASNDRWMEGSKAEGFGAKVPLPAPPDVNDEPHGKSHEGDPRKGE